MENTIQTLTHVVTTQSPEVVNQILDVSKFNLYSGTFFLSVLLVVLTASYVLLWKNKRLDSTDRAGITLLFVVFASLFGAILFSTLSDLYQVYYAQDKFLFDYFAHAVRSGK